MLPSIAPFLQHDTHISSLHKILPCLLRCTNKSYLDEQYAYTYAHAQRAQIFVLTLVLTHHQPLTLSSKLSPSPLPSLSPSPSPTPQSPSFHSIRFDCGISTARIFCNETKTRSFVSMLADPDCADEVALSLWTHVQCNV